MESYYSNVNGIRTHQNGYHVTRVTAPAWRGGLMTGLEHGEGLLTSTEDKKVLMQVVQKHSSDDFQLAVSCLLDYVKTIFDRATSNGMPENEPTIAANFGTRQDDLPRMIDRVWCEMACKCPGGVEPHNSTLAVLGVLEHCPWEAKMVITLAALVVNYWEFLQISQMYSNNPLAKSMVLLKQLPDDTKLDAINQLIALMFEVTKHVVWFKESLESDYFSAEEPCVKDLLDTFPVMAYWIIRSTVAAATQISIIANTTHDQFMKATATQRELKMRSEKLDKILTILEEKITYLKKIIEEKEEEKAYNALFITIFKTVHQHNTTVIQTLTYSHDDERPLFKGRDKVRLKDLRGNTVLLLITARDERRDVLMTLCDELKTCDYSIVWVPVADSLNPWTDTTLTHHRDFLSVMPWYSVHNPSIIGKEVIKFFKRELNFNGLPTLVPLDGMGKINTMNVLHMTRIWRNKAFPFTIEQAKKLWKEAEDSWLDLLLPNNSDQTISDWVKKSKYIFAYGGDVNSDWIKKFTNATKTFARVAKMEVECVYVGKSCRNKMVTTVRSVTDCMLEEKLGHYLKDDLMRGFWTRLESMLHTNVQLDTVNTENDMLLQEIKKIISYDKNVASWAVICKGSRVISSASGTTIHEVLSKYEEWQVQVDELGFEKALRAQIFRSGRPERNCFRFDFPNAGGKIPVAMKCPGCPKTMQVYTTFQCCHDDPN